MRILLFPLLAYNEFIHPEPVLSLTSAATHATLDIERAFRRVVRIGWLMTLMILEVGGRLKVEGSKCLKRFSTG